MRWLWEPISLVLFPPTCGSCAAAMVQRSAFGLCDTCFSTLKRADGAGFKAEGHLAYAAYRYQGAMRALVRAAKFAGREDLACALGELLAADPRARVLAAKACCIVPVPLAGPRYRQRGFNQSAAMARQLARRWQLPLRHALRRSRHAPPQSSLPQNARQQNVRGAFAVRRPLWGTVVLVDDVITSGATAAAAAAASRAAGASAVVVLAAAQAGRSVGPVVPAACPPPCPSQETS
jgi:ComF family protein